MGELPTKSNKDVGGMKGWRGHREAAAFVAIQLIIYPECLVNLLAAATAFNIYTFV